MFNRGGAQGSTGGEGGGLQALLSNPDVLSKLVGLVGALGQGKSVDRSSPYGGGGGGGGGGSEWSKWSSSDDWSSSKKSEELPTLVTLQISQAAPVCQAGYSPQVLAVEHSKDMQIFSDAHFVLIKFLESQGGTLKDFVQFDHDPEAENFPEVYEAWKAAGQEDNLPTIATCPNLGQWAIGMGGKKNAERAAKLSLAVTLASVSDMSVVQGICSSYPNFGLLLQQIGIEVPGLPQPRSKSKKWWGGGGGDGEWGSTKKTDGLPMTVTLNIPLTSAICQSGYSPQVYVLEHSNMSIFSDAHFILSSFFDDVEGTLNLKEIVQFDHDPECANFPEVYQAWKDAGQEDNLPTIATCSSLGQWAVGMGGKKNAERAAKLALALTLATVSDPVKVATIIQNYPNFGLLCQQIGMQIA